MPSEESQDGVIAPLGTSMRGKGANYALRVLPEGVSCT